MRPAELPNTSGCACGTGDVGNSAVVTLQGQAGPRLTRGVAVCGTGDVGDSAVVTLQGQAGPRLTRGVKYMLCEAYKCLITMPYT